MPKRAPILDTYYGFPVCYRVEHRAVGETRKTTLILSYREDEKIIYDHGARRIRGVDELLEKFPNRTPDDPQALTFLESLPHKTMVDFFEKFLKIPDGSMITDLIAYRDGVALPLGVMLAAEFNTLLNRDGKNRTAASAEDDKRAIKRLLKNEGSTPWNEVTPEKSHHWLRRMTTHARIGCARIMRALFLEMCRMRFADGISPWDGYQPNKVAKPPQDAKSLIQQHVNHSMLTDGQCEKIVAMCLENRQVSGLRLALLLKLVLPLSEKELCGLDLDHFTYLQEYAARMTVDIKNEATREDGKTNYRLNAIEDQYQCRRLPVPHVIKDYYEQLKKARGIAADAKPKPGMPLITMECNSQRRMRPCDLAKKFNDLLKVCEVPQPVQKKYCGSFASMLSQLEKTAVRELRKSGCEEEEMRFLQGRRPLLVSAKNYADFFNEAELNKLGAIQDRWLNRLGAPSWKADGMSETIYRGKKEFWKTDCVGSATEVEINIVLPQLSDPIDFTKIPEEGLIFELGVLHGMTGKVSYRLPPQEPGNEKRGA